MTSYKAGDLAIEHNVDIHPALFAVEPLPAQCLQAFQSHSVLVKDVESVIKGFSSNNAPSYDKVSASVGRLRNSSQYENVYITQDYAKAIQMERKVSGPQERYECKGGRNLVVNNNVYNVDNIADNLVQTKCKF